MNRRATAAAVFLMLATILWLREAPPVYVIGITLIAIAGLAGFRFDVHRDRRWTAAVWAVGIAWVGLRIGVAEGGMGTFVAEALLAVLATDLCRQPKNQGVPRSFSLISVLTLIAAMQQRVTFENLIWFTLLGMATVLTLAILAVQQRSIQTRESGPPKRFRTRRIATTAAVIAFAAFASFKTSEAWGEQLSALENRIDVLLSNFVTDSIPRLYPRTGSLNSIRNEKLHDPDAVAIRIYSRKKPGYMTGRVFDGFNSRTLNWSLWSPQYREEKGLQRLTQRAPEKSSGIRVPQGQNIFRITSGTPSRKLQIYEIENRSGRGEMVFTPQGAQYVRGYGRQVRLDDHGVVHFGINCASKYVTYADPTARSGSPDVISEVLLQVPERIEVDLTPLVEEIAGDATTFEEKTSAVQLYFADSDFKYSNRTNPDGVPWSQFLQHFITTGKRGHCELFATGTVLMLRMQGVPARYATGYVVDGRDPDDQDYWAALNRNCHAWAEAWDADEQQWVIVETTPGMNFATAETTGEGGASDLEIDDAMEDASGAGASGLSSQKWIRVMQWTGLGLASVFLIGILMRFSTRSGRPAAVNPEILRLDRRLAKKGITRETGETLHEFADRVEQIDSTKLPAVSRAEAAEFYRQYGSLLYAGLDSEIVSLTPPTI